MKATQATTFRSLESEISRINKRVEDLRLQATSGKKLRKASDDPSAVRPVLNARARIKASDDYIRTTETAANRLSIQDTYLSQAENLLISAREIAVAAGNSAMNDQDLATYGARMGNILDELYAVANAKVNGKYLFAGFEEQTLPFPDPADPGNYQGDTGSVKLEIGPGETVPVNLNGADLFQGAGGGLNVFQLLSDIQTDLMAGNSSQVTAQLDNLEAASQQISGYRGQMGNIAQRVEGAQMHQEDVRIDMQQILSNYEDADLLETLSSLTQQETALEAALKITSEVSQLSIIDYL